MTNTITDDISWCNSYLEEDETAKNVKNKQSYIKALLNKTIIKPEIKVKATIKPYLYTSTALKRECMAIVDSETTGHLLQIQSECVDKREKNDGMEVKLPDGTIITAIHIVLLDIHQLPMKAYSRIFSLKSSTYYFQLLCCVMRAIWPFSKMRKFTS